MCQEVMNVFKNLLQKIQAPANSTSLSVNNYLDLLKIRWLILAEFWQVITRGRSLIFLCKLDGN